MIVLVIVDRVQDWNLRIPDVQVVSARDYLVGNDESWARGTRVFNLCKSYAYQSLGYYVSLLAQARGHRGMPSVTTSQDLSNRSLLRLVSDDLDERIQRNLSRIQSGEFVLSIYFGQNLAERYARLANDLFNLFPAPLLRARFVRLAKRWELRTLHPIGTREIPDSHWEFLEESARRYLSRRRGPRTRRETARFDLAILVNPEDEHGPSNRQSLDRFRRAAESLGFSVEIVTREDYGRIAEFDALFIRETTSVNHHTYRFARRADAEGLVVLDDPDSIVRCTNKVYLAELLQRTRVRTPKTIVMHRDNVEEAARELGFPCILKLPDSSFSQGVVRVKDSEELKAKSKEFLEASDLIIAQEYFPTEFDWRVGVLDNEVLYVCRYFMADSHWQIIARDSKGKFVEDGRVENVPVDAAPRHVIDTALRATRPIGNGLYGVDVKERAGKAYVIEVNDNPSIDHPFEDALLGDELYLRIMKSFLRRVEAKKSRASNHV